MLAVVDCGYQLNARGLRGIRENDQFVVCLQGEDYQKRAEKVQAALDAEAVGSNVVGELPTPPSSMTDSSSASVSPSSIPSRIDSTQPLLLPSLSSSGLQYGQTSFVSSASITSAAPPRGMGGFMSAGMKGNKRYRSISGKMAAIKSMGDKGLISADDRGHLKDLLLNNDSPQLQEALDNYNSTGDFQAVKAILLKELSNPSTKRNAAGDEWLSQKLIDDITINFVRAGLLYDGVSLTLFKWLMLTMDCCHYCHVITQNTNDSSDPQQPVVQSLALPANPFMYQPSSDNNSTSNNIAHYHQQQASPVSMGYATSSSSSPVGPEYTHHSHQQQQHQDTMSSGYPDQSSIINPDPYSQSHHQTGMYGAPQVNLPLRNRNSMNLLMKQGTYGVAPSVQMMGTSPTQMDMRYANGGPSYASQGGPSMGPPPMYPTNMGYPSDMSPDYNRVGIAYGMLPSNGMGYNPMMQQQQQQQYSINRYPYGGGMMDGGAPGMPGYEYYQNGYGVVGGGGVGGYDKSQMRNGSKWTTAPPMPSYPPACSKEEKKEKIAKWLKKRENRNWSNKPSYPVRHSIAKNRKRGEDGRFITKARLAQMALEEAAAGGAGVNGGISGVGVIVHPEGSNDYDDEADDYDEHVSMATLPVPTSVP